MRTRVSDVSDGGPESLSASSLSRASGQGPAGALVTAERVAQYFGSAYTEHARSLGHPWCLFDQARNDYLYFWPLPGGSMRVEIYQNGPDAVALNGVWSLRHLDDDVLANNAWES